jgi:hypothetical protein
MFSETLELVPNLMRPVQLNSHDEFSNVSKICIDNPTNVYIADNYKIVCIAWNELQYFMVLLLFAKDSIICVSKLYN